MKKICSNQLFVAIALSLCANSLFAQGAYLNLNAGYALNTSAGNLDYFDFYNYTSSPNSETLEQVNVSLGKGVNVGLAFGYMFNENLSAELGISYLLGGKSKAKDIYSGGTTDYTLSSKMIRINPSVVVSCGFENINPYAKLGLVAGIGSVLFELKDVDSGDILLIKQKLDGGIALGFSSGLGAMFNLSDNMSLFGELNMVNLSYAPTKGELTEASYNGVDELPNLTISEKETEFVDSYTDNGNSPDSQPSKELKQKLPFGSFGLNFGLRFSF